MRVVPFCFFALLVSCTQVEPQRDDVRKHIEQKIAKSQQAWAVEDVDAIIRHEHSNIHKLMAVDNVIIGKEASRADLEVALKSYKFSLKNYEIENFELTGDVATFYAKVTLKGVPKTDGYPFSVRTRTFTVWVRDKKGPEEWLAFREVVQAEPVTQE